MIAFEQWANQNGAKIDFWHTYFQVEGSQRKANQQLVGKTQVTLGKETIVPDINVGILTQNTSHLFTLELHRQPKTQRIVQQRAKHADILRNEVLSEKYNHPHLHYVFSVHHSEQSMRLEQRELQKSVHCEHVEDMLPFYSLSVTYKKLSQRIDRPNRNSFKLVLNLKKYSLGIFWDGTHCHFLSWFDT